MRSCGRPAGGPAPGYGREGSAPCGPCVITADSLEALALLLRCGEEDLYEAAERAATD